jgi:hypothetical protein
LKIAVIVLFVAVLLVGTGADCGGSSPTFANVNTQVFQVNCELSGCHNSGATAAVGGLNLQTDPYTALLGPDGTGAPAVNPECYPYVYPNRLLVTPGDPSNSLLYLKVSGTGAGMTGCTQFPDAGTACGSGSEPACCPNGEQMPYNSGTIGSNNVQLIHDWIAAGAKND